MQTFSKIFKIFFKAFNHQLFRRLNESGAGTVFAEPNVVYGGDLPNPTSTQSFGSVLFNRMMRTERRNDVFQVCPKTKERMTLKECLKKSVALAERFQEEGVQKGDFILLIGNNSLNMNISLIGTFFLGAVPFPLTCKTHLDEFRYIVRFLKPKYFGCEGKYLYFFKKALVDVSDFDVSKIFVINDWNFSDESKKAVTFDDFIKGRGENFESFQPVEVNDPKEDLALLLKTTSEGLDGKFVGITHYNLNSVVARFDAMENKRNLKEEVILMVQKVIWMSGLYCLLMACCHETKLIVMHSFEEESFMKAIEEFRVTTTFLYYAKCWQLLKYSTKSVYDMSSCTYFYSIDGFLPDFFTKKLKDKLGILPKNSYGFPEFSGLILEASAESGNGSTGKLVPQSYGKVVSEETSRNAGPNERGELCFKGPTLCKGYLNDEKAFKNSIDSEGYFLTGHYGYYDERGEFFIIDKINHQIQYKNHKISPKELEAIIRSLDPVKDACVGGLQHETDGAYPIAFVSLQKGQNITEQDIIKYVNEKVPDYKRIRGVVFISKMPRNKESGGINRKVFKKALARFRVKGNADIQDLAKKIQDPNTKLKKADEQVTS